MIKYMGWLVGDLMLKLCVHIPNQIDLKEKYFSKYCQHSWYEILQSLVKPCDKSKYYLYLIRTDNVNLQVSQCQTSWCGKSKWIVITMPSKSAALNQLHMSMFKGETENLQHHTELMCIYNHQTKSFLFNTPYQSRTISEELNSLKFYPGQ